MLAYQHVEHALAGVQARVGVSADQPQVQNATRATAHIQNVWREFPQMRGEQGTDPLRLARLCRVLGIPCGCNRVKGRVNAGDRVRRVLDAVMPVGGRLVHQRRRLE